MGNGSHDLRCRFIRASLRLERQLAADLLRALEAGPQPEGDLQVAAGAFRVADGQVALGDLLVEERLPLRASVRGPARAGSIAPPRPARWSARRRGSRRAGSGRAARARSTRTAPRRLGMVEVLVHRQRALEVGAPLVLLGEEELAVHPVAQLEVMAQVIAAVGADEALVQLHRLRDVARRAGRRGSAPPAPGDARLRGAASGRTEDLRRSRSWRAAWRRSYASRRPACESTRCASIRRLICAVAHCVRAALRSG